jgi:DNA-binding transcriptional ArsR family regulator
VNSDQAPDCWSALADGNRRAIVSRLADGPLPVVQIAAELPITRSGVSQHLQILKHAGLVSEHASGTRRIYRLNSSTLATLRDQLDSLWRRSIRGDPNAASQEAESG